MKENLISQAGFSNTFEKDRLYKLIDLVVKECIQTVKNTPTNCAITTYDLGVAECTIQRSLDQLTTKFNLPPEKRDTNERPMGREISTKNT